MKFEFVPMAIKPRKFVDLPLGTVIIATGLFGKWIVVNINGSHCLMAHDFSGAHYHYFMPTNAIENRDFTVIGKMEFKE